MTFDDFCIILSEIHTDSTGISGADRLVHETRLSRLSRRKEEEEEHGGETRVAVRA